MTFRFSKLLVQEVFDKSGGRCWYCGIELMIESRNQLTPQTYCIDHVMPINKGGKHEMSNLVACCWTCNNLKRTYTIEEFRALMTRLKNNMPRFSAEQTNFMNSHGIKLPEFTSHVFYFEES